LLAFKPKTSSDATNVTPIASAPAEKKTSELAGFTQAPLKPQPLQNAQIPQPEQIKPREAFLAVIPKVHSTVVPTPVLAQTSEGDFWNQLVREMVEAQAINALVRELALQSQLMARDNQQWTLQVDKDSLNTPSNCERLQAVLAQFGHEVQLTVVMGAVEDSTAKRIKQENAERQARAEEIILQDPFVQSLMRDFDAKIVPGSIKPV